MLWQIRSSTSKFSNKSKLGFVSASFLRVCINSIVVTSGWPQADQLERGCCLSAGAKGRGKQVSDAEPCGVVSAWVKPVGKWWNETRRPFFLASLERGNQLEEEERKQLIHWAAAESISSRSSNRDMASDLTQLRSYRVSGMTWVNKPSDEMCPFMHNKCFFVVLATAWRCIYPSGTVWVDVVRVTSWLPVRVAAHLLQHHSSLADYSKLGHEMFDDLHLLTVPLDCTQSIALSSYSVHPVSSLLNRCSAAPWDDLNWLNRSTAVAPMHTPVWVPCVLGKLLHNTLSFTSESVNTRNLYEWGELRKG